MRLNEEARCLIGLARWAIGLAFTLVPMAGPVPALSQVTQTGPSALAQLAQPGQRVLFRDVVLATTGQRLLSLDTNNPAHRQLIQLIGRAAERALAQARTRGLVAARPNEAGNAIEPLVRAALREVGLAAQVPTNRTGRAQAAG